jgi:hypothetical protein
MSLRRWRMTVAVATLLGCPAAVATAQPSSGDAAPFHSEWLVLGGVGSDARSTSDRQVAFQSVEWGRILSGEHGPGVLAGRLEMVIAITPVFVAFQSGDAEGAGFDNGLVERAVAVYTTLAFQCVRAAGPPRTPGAAGWKPGLSSAVNRRPERSDRSYRLRDG